MDASAYSSAEHLNTKDTTDTKENTNFCFAPWRPLC
jgi:hypothetical protein